MDWGEFGLTMAGGIATTLGLAFRIGGTASKLTARLDQFEQALKNHSITSQTQLNNLAQQTDERHGENLRRLALVERALDEGNERISGVKERLAGVEAALGQRRGKRNESPGS